jgi:hypothetical protein
MFFHEGRDLNQRQHSEPEACTRINPGGPRTHDSVCDRMNAEHHRFKKLASPAPPGSELGDSLDSANNKLQKLMQLLYLLSRDPAVPNDARYHVTMAQSEIALLARLIQNNAEAERSEGQAGLESNAAVSSYEVAATK